MSNYGKVSDFVRMILLRHVCVDLTTTDSNYFLAFEELFVLVVLEATFVVLVLAFVLAFVFVLVVALVLAVATFDLAGFFAFAGLLSEVISSFERLLLILAALFLCIRFFLTDLSTAQKAALMLSAVGLVLTFLIKVLVFDFST